MLFAGRDGRPSAPPPLAKTLAPGVAAQVGEEVITDARVARWLEAINPDAKSVTPSDIANALDVVAVDAYVQQEGKRRGMSVSAEQVAARKVSAVDGAPAADITAFRQRETLLDVMAERAAGPVPKASDAQVQAAAQELANHIGRPEVRDYFEIAAKDREQITKAVKSIRGGMAPSTAVARYSDDPASVATDGYTPSATVADLARVSPR